ncbi:hypothetical protein P7K49_020113 [Saguinus oedipus]|uniref:Cholinephosphotransferase 1 n=1 Tax=Saguinus oedipus TaxID=9490 RepID=A0ABQ9UZC5_SAGOE|nr:hypothetical protein P7K49_020113 [Saguinus oedipus]
MAVGASIAARLGTHPDWLFFCSFIGMFVFYCAHWQTYVSGVLRFGKVDVTEIQIALVIVFVLSAFGGATVWDYTSSFLLLSLSVYNCEITCIFQKTTVISSFDMVIYFSALCLQISRHLHLNIFKTACHQAPEQVHKHID